MDGNAAHAATSKASRTERNGINATQKDRADEKTKTIPVYRSTKYKEKFQAMRDSYETVTALNQTYQQELQNANERIKLLQEENDLLLDAMQFAPNYQPELGHQLEVLLAEDKREKWIRDHPAQYNAIVRSQQLEGARNSNIADDSGPTHLPHSSQQDRSVVSAGTHGDVAAWQQPALR